jgi:hypothetical protein
MLTQFYNYILTGFRSVTVADADATPKKRPHLIAQAISPPLLPKDVFEYRQPLPRSGEARNIGLVLCPTADFVDSSVVLREARATVNQMGQYKIIPFIEDTVAHLKNANLQDDANFATATMLSLFSVMGLEVEIDSFMLLKNCDVAAQLMALIDTIKTDAPSFYTQFVRLWTANEKNVTTAYTPEAQRNRTQLLALYLHTKEAILPALMNSIIYSEQADGLNSLIPPIFRLPEVKMVLHAGVKDPVTQLGFSAPENNNQLMPFIVSAPLVPAYDDAKHTVLTAALMREPSTIVLQRQIDDKLQQGLADYFTPRAIIPNAKPFEA